MKRIQEVLLDPQVDVLLEKDQAHLFEMVPILQSLTIELPGTKNLWEHSLAVCSGVPCDAYLRWAALFHDVGKPVVFKTDKPKVGGTFPNHAMVGAEIWLDNAPRFGRVLSSEEIKAVERLVRYHMQILSYTPAWGDVAVSSLIDRYRGDIQSAVILAIADGGDYECLDHLLQRANQDG